MMDGVRISVEGDHVRVHYLDRAGQEHSFPLSVEAGVALVGQLTEKLNELRSSPELQEKLGGAIVKTLFSFLGKRS